MIELEQARGCGGGCNRPGEADVPPAAMGRAAAGLACAIDEILEACSHFERDRERHQEVRAARVGALRRSKRRGQRACDDVVAVVVVDGVGEGSVRLRCCERACANLRAEHTCLLRGRMPRRMARRDTADVVACSGERDAERVEQHALQRVHAGCADVVGLRVERAARQPFRDVRRFEVARNPNGHAVSLRVFVQQKSRRTVIRRDFIERR